MVRKRESGQALVLVLLSLAVVLTLVLFVLSRSVSDISVSSSQEQSVRAFSAAEAGIEKALVIGANNGSTANGSSYSAVVSGFSQGTTSFNYPSTLMSGDSVTIWFVAHDANGKLICDNSSPSTKCFKGTSIKICWGNSGAPVGQPTTPAVELSVYYETTPGSAATMRVARASYDPNNPSVPRSNPNFFSATDSGSCQVGGVTYAFQKTVQFGSDLNIPAASYNSDQGGLQFARVRMFYNTDAGQSFGATVTGTAGSTLPSQGQNIVSTGTAGGSNRRINVLENWSESPFGGNAVFSPPGVVK